MALNFSGFMADSRGFIGSPKCAMSMASVLATRPDALAKLLTWPGLQTTMGNPALWAAMTQSSASRPVDSISIRSGLIA